jgi:DNA-binding transcriptional ArsR family regulator
VKKPEECKMRDLRDKGFTVDEIADRLKRTPRTVSRHLKPEKPAETASYGQSSQVLPRELFADVKRLAERLAWLTNVPEPARPFLALDHEDVTRIKNAFLKGDGIPLAKTITTGLQNPWWGAKSPVNLKLYLAPAQRALFDRFAAAPTSQGLDEKISDWEQKTTNYIRLKGLNANSQEIQAAYQEAKKAEQVLHSTLWNAVEALRWGA